MRKTLATENDFQRVRDAPSVDAGYIAKHSQKRETLKTKMVKFDFF